MLKHMDIYYNTWTNSQIYYITKPAITLINWTLTSKPGHSLLNLDAKNKKCIKQLQKPCHQLMETSQMSVHHQD